MFILSYCSILTTILVSLVSIGLSKEFENGLIHLIIVSCTRYKIYSYKMSLTIHIPLNNHIQNIKIEKLNEKSIADERINFFQFFLKL